MAVNLTKAEIRQFELAGITREMIGKTIERDRAAGLPDNEIELRAAAKAERLEKANPSITGEIFGMTIPNEDIDRGIRSMKRGITRGLHGSAFGDSINRSIQAIGATYDTIADKIHGRDTPTVRQYLEAPEGAELPNRSFGEIWKQHYDEGMKRVDRTVKEMNYDIPKYVRYPLDTATTVSSYGLIPAKSIPAEMAIYGADAFQEGYNKDAGDRLINAGIGASIVGALGGGGAMINKFRNAAKAAKPTPTEVVKNEVSETLAKSLSEKRPYKYGVSASGDELSVLMNRAPTYADKETLVKQLPSIVKQSKEVGTQLKNAAQDNVNKSYLELVTENLKKRADLMETTGSKASADKIRKIADSLKDKKLTENIDDLFTKGVTEAEDSLASAESKKITDIIDDYLDKIGKSEQLTKSEKDIIKKDMFNTGMTRRAAKRIAFIDEAKMAKDVTEAEVKALKKKAWKGYALTGLGTVTDLALGGTGLAGGIGGALISGLTRARPKVSEVAAKRASQMNLQQSLKTMFNKAKKEDEIIRTTIKEWKGLSQSQKEAKADVIRSILKGEYGEVAPEQVSTLTRMLREVGNAGLDLMSVPFKTPVKQSIIGGANKSGDIDDTRKTIIDVLK